MGGRRDERARGGRAAAGRSDHARLARRPIRTLRSDPAVGLNLVPGRRARRRRVARPLPGDGAAGAYGRLHAGAHRVALRFTPEIAALLGAAFCNAVAHGALYAFLSLHLEALGYSGTTI